MKRPNRQFVAFYINRLEFFSGVGLFPMRWSEPQNKFVTGSWRDLFLNAFLSLSIFVEMLYTTIRAGIYVLLTPMAQQELNEMVLLITWTIIVHGSWFGITTLWKGGGLVKIVSTSVVKSIAKLQTLVGVTEKNDPIRARLVHYGDWYWALLTVYVFGILELYRIDPKNQMFLYSVTNFDGVISYFAWIPFLTLNLMNAGFYIATISFFGHYLRICSVSLLEGSELLSPQAHRPCKFSQAMAWYRRFSILMLILNESIGPSLLMSTILHLAGLSLVSFTIIRLRSQLSLITCCLYYVILVQIIMYTVQAYQTMGMLPATTTRFLAKWKRFTHNKKEVRILNSIRPQGMDFSGLFIYKKAQIMHIGNIGVNMVIFFLTLDR